jgi:hypothetical protein
MTTSAPSSPVYLPPPTSPLTRQVAVCHDIGFGCPSGPYWNRRELPPLFSEATAFEADHGHLTLPRAVEALRQAWKLRPDYDLCVFRPRGYAFHIAFALPSASNKSAWSFGIPRDVALEYVACEYIRHRYEGDHLRIPMEFRSTGWRSDALTALVRAGAIYLEFRNHV